MEEGRCWQIARSLVAVSFFFFGPSFLPFPKVGFCPKGPGPPLIYVAKPLDLAGLDSSVANACPPQVCPQFAKEAWWKKELLANGVLFSMSARSFFPEMHAKLG